MRYIILLTILFALLLSACSGYNKVIKSDDYDRKMEYAARYYEEQQWDRAATLYEQIYQRYSKGPKGEESYFKLAKCNYEMKDYYLAGYYFNNYRERFFLSPYAEEATFLSAMCAVKNSPNYSMDQTDTRKALMELQRFVNYYPESSLVDSCNVIMDKLQYKLEKKAYEGAKLYNRMENYRATVSAFDAFVEDFPNSENKEEAMYLALRSQFLLAQNSIENKKFARYEDTIKRCRKFAGLYPSSKYLKEIENYRRKSEKEIETLTKN